MTATWIFLEGTWAKTAALACRTARREGFMLLPGYLEKLCGAVEQRPAPWPATTSSGKPTRRWKERNDNRHTHQGTRLRKKVPTVLSTQRRRGRGVRRGRKQAFPRRALRLRGESTGHFP